MKIGLVHATINSVIPILNAFKELHPTVDIVNFMDESLIFELNETNNITHDMTRRLIEQVSKAENAGVDAILLTCSSFSPHVKQFKHLFNVPILSSDESMLEKAVHSGKKIGVIATVEKAGPTTTKLLYDTAANLHKKIEVETIVVTEAFQALQKGDEVTHDNLIHNEIDRLKKTNHVILLAQYSMSRAIKTYQDDAENIITGPEVGANSIVELATKFNNK
ncbi:aspartate/glutamate racemase family protein [Chryseomicrobium palamuruense]|uniref:Aspartate/glutamate racemase family protein n=1 Tax=Chryseomicrobium palamuruense TaxID=682973 RepID=A0ABV8UUX5_9BACL